eukprot:142879_1
MPTRFYNHGEYINGNSVLVFISTVFILYYGHTFITFTAEILLLLSFSFHIYIYRRLMFRFTFETADIKLLTFSIIKTFVNGSFNCGLTILFSFITYQWRVLPNVIVLGEQKCGTTTLAHYFRKVLKWKGPSLSFVRDNTLNDKDSLYFKGVYDSYMLPKYYSMCFPLKITDFLYNKWKQTQTLYFDTSPSYLFLPFVRDRILKLHQNNPFHLLKFIVIVRDPKDRAISNMRWELNFEKFFKSYGWKRKIQIKTMKEMIEFCQTNEFNQNYNKLKKIKWNERVPDFYALIERFGVIQKGQYKNSLEWYFEHQFFRQNTLILDLKELSKSPGKCIKKICEFMNIDDRFIDYGSIEKVHLNAQREYNNDSITFDVQTLLQQIYK